MLKTSTPRRLGHSGRPSPTCSSRLPKTIAAGSSNQRRSPSDMNWRLDRQGSIDRSQTPTLIAIQMTGHRGCRRRLQRRRIGTTAGQRLWTPGMKPAACRGVTHARHFTDDQVLRFTRFDERVRLRYCVQQCLRVRMFGRTKQRIAVSHFCLLYTSPSPRDATLSRMPSSA